MYRISVQSLYTVCIHSLVFFELFNDRHGGIQNRGWGNRRLLPCLSGVANFGISSPKRIIFGFLNRFGIGESPKLIGGFGKANSVVWKLLFF